MSDIICKYLNQDGIESYNYLSEYNGGIIKDNIEFAYFSEYDIIKRIRENKEGYFDFSKNLIDVGACYGAYSMLLDFNHNYAFEPGRDKCCLLYANMYLRNKVNNTDVYNVAISDKNGKVKFNGYWCEGYNTIETIYASPMEMYEVQSKTLDEFNINNVGFIKIDVEGMEEKMLRSGVSTIIRNNYPPILFECWDVGTYGMTQEKRDSLFSFLKWLGYDILEYWGQFDTHLAIHK